MTYNVSLQLIIRNHPLTTLPPGGFDPAFEFFSQPYEALIYKDAAPGVLVLTIEACELGENGGGCKTDQVLKRTCFLKQSFSIYSFG